MSDVCDHVAAMLHPMPTPGQVPDEVFDDVVDQVGQDREREAGGLRLAWEETGHDPLLSALSGLARQRAEIEDHIRVLLAYARTFAHPRPYPLTDLAVAAGMSFSGVRTAYHDDHVTAVADRTGLRPPRRPGPAEPAEPPPPAPTARPPRVAGAKSPRRS
jgi:hypothetical protein